MISFKILFEIMKRTIQLQSPHIIIQMLNNLAILDTHDTTNAFPIQKYRIFSRHTRIRPVVGKPVEPFAFYRCQRSEPACLQVGDNVRSPADLCF